MQTGMKIDLRDTGCKGALYIGEISEHDIGVNESERFVTECAGQGSDDRKAELFPEFDCRCVGRDDKIELHRAKTGFFCFTETMISHEPSDSSTLLPRGDHKRRVRYMRAPTALIGNQFIHAKNPSTVFCDV